MEPPGPERDSASTGFRRTLGVVFIAVGLFLLALGLGVLPIDAGPRQGARVLAVSGGALFCACGVLAGQWVPAGSRLYDAMGATVMTAMAVIAGWVALLGEAEGFRATVGAAGASVTSRGSVTGARIAFGIGAAVLVSLSLWAWRRVLRRGR